MQNIDNIRVSIGLLKMYTIFFHTIILLRCIPNRISGKCIKITLFNLSIIQQYSALFKNNKMYSFELLSKIILRLMYVWVAGWGRKKVERCRMLSRIGRQLRERIEDGYSRCRQTYNIDFMLQLYYILIYYTFRRSLLGRCE